MDHALIVMFQLIASLGVVFSTIAVIVLLMKRLLAQKAKVMSGVAFRALAQNSSSPVIEMWVSTYGANHNALFMNKTISTARFLNILQEQYPKSTFVTRSCSMYGNTCNTIFKVEGENDQTCLISLNWSDHIFKDANTAAYTAKFELEDYLTEDGKLTVSYTTELVSDYSHESSFIQFILDAVKASEIERIYVDMKPDHTVLYKLHVSKGDVDLRPFKIPIHTLHSRYLNLAYEPVEIQFEGENHSIPMSELFSVLESTIELSSNAAIFGIPGSGKTVLVEGLAKHLSEELGYKVIMVPANVVSNLLDPAACAQFVSIIQFEKERGNEVVLIIDEAESLVAKNESGIHSEASTLMLQLLDGTLKRELNIPVVMVFNTKIENLNPAVFRAQRMAQIPIVLKPLKEERARLLVEYLKVHLPGKSFDSKTFELKLKQQNTMSDGTIYAEAGYISLADVYSTFLDQDRRVLISTILRRTSEKTISAKPAKEAITPKIKVLPIPEQVATEVAPRIVRAPVIVSRTNQAIEAALSDIPKEKKAQHQNIPRRDRRRKPKSKK